MKKDRVTLEAAEDYGRRCKSIGKERRNTADLQDAMNHPNFKQRHHALLDQLAAECRQSKPIFERPSFMTVKLGTHKTNKDLCKALLAAGFQIDRWESGILDRVKMAEKPEDVNIVMVSVAEFGFPYGTNRARIYEKALSIGLGLLPAEVGPQLWLQYSDQPLGEWIHIGMEPITDSIGCLKAFYIGRNDNGRWLSVCDGNPGTVFHSGNRLAFCRPKLPVPS